MQPILLASLSCRASRREFSDTQLPENASAQVRSVCGRFALVAAAGSLATALGLTGWPDDAADCSSAACFCAWLERRGSAGDHDIEAGIRQVIAFIEAHGSSRFEAAWQETCGARDQSSGVPSPTGWRTLGVHGAP
jgi:putative DNA primase/helicase